MLNRNVEGLDESRFKLVNYFGANNALFHIVISHSKF
jgi:hypothetical protein